MKTDTLDSELLHKMNAYWRAANYLSVGQIYLYDNPLLKRPLRLSDVKPLVVGHWGTTPGQNFIYVHLNRVIKKYDLDMFYRRSRSRRPGDCGQRLPGRNLERGVSQCHTGRSRAKRAVQTILLSRRHLQPCCPHNAGIDP